MDTLQSSFDLARDAHNSQQVSRGFRPFVFMSNSGRLAPQPQRRLLHRVLAQRSQNDRLRDPRERRQKNRIISARKSSRQRTK